MKRWLQFILLLLAVPAFGYAPEPRQLLSAHAYEPNSALRLNENLDYTYDASHNLASRTANTLTQAFSSDAANELASITRSGTLTVSGSITGAVAALGVNGQPAVIYSDGTFATTSGLTLRDGNNMFVTTGSNSSGALVLSTITSNRLPVTVNFAYDLNGNMLADGQRVLEYDDANRLTAVTASNLYRTEFVYDGLSRRRIVRDYNWSSGNWQSAGETDYVCDGYLPIQERDASGNVLVTYTRGLDLSGTFGGAGGIGGLLARTDSSGSAFYHADIVGNITSLTDGNGNSVARYLQDPFGRPLGMWGPTGPVNRMQVSSMPTDPSGGVHFPYRDYDTILQRFRTRDLLGERADINPYRINYNNSLSYIDPDGLAPQLVTLTYDLNGRQTGAGYVDYYQGQDYGIGKHTPLEEPTLVQAQKVFDQAAAASYDPNVDALTTAGLYSAGVALFVMGVLDFVPDSKILTQPLKKVACRTVDQYALKAVEDGFYPMMKRGFKEPQSGVWLNAGDVWKYGTTKNPATRYSESFLDEWRLRYRPQFSGRLGEALAAEKANILQYEAQHGMLPPGNKIRR